jgi:DNA polymerase-3 subunit delta'
MSFTQFLEQQTVVKLLQRSLDRGRLSHAYLFAGSTLSGLELMAATLAKTLTCANPPRKGSSGVALDCCDRCLSCRKIDDGNHADIQWVRPESKSRVITIDQIRDLMRTIFLKPLESSSKVAVIVAADRLTVQAANAFLKTLEEPPSRSTVLLLSTDPERVLETISSRCLRLNFGGGDGFQANQAQIDWLTRFTKQAAVAQKSLLGRYRLLSAILARLGQTKTEIENALTARSPLTRHQDVDPQLKEKWEDELTAAIEAEYRRQRGEVLLLLEWWMRDVWLIRLGLGEKSLAFPGSGLDTQIVSSRISANDAARNLKLMEETHRLLGSNVQEALALEVSFLKLKL